ncbi:MAG: hypothetical protein H6772_02770 [Pseudomonadales bacterium]|nr:hypothetical protein [Pseudomonadales bacterium]
MNIYPSILTDEIEVASEQVDLCRNNSQVQTIQFDVIDGYFADNVTVFPSDLTFIDFGNLNVDFHLMTQEPMDFVYEIVDAKEFLPVRGIIGQVEQMTSQVNFLQEVKKNGWFAGLSLNLHTPLEAIEKDAWQYIDIIQIMGVRAGFQGQEFHLSSLDVVSELNNKIQDRNLNIEVMVDGGVKLNNSSEIESYGVDSVTVGSELWNSEDFDGTYSAYLD